MNGRAVPANPERCIRLRADRLFEALFVESSATAKASENERMSNRASVLDALRESARQLAGSLDTSDRGKLDQYLTSVRDVERRLQMSEAWLDKPKPKSPIDTIKDEERMQIEEIPLFLDLMTLALQTDSTRVATFEIPLQFHTNHLDVGSYHRLSHAKARHLKRSSEFCLCPKSKSSRC